MRKAEASGSSSRPNKVVQSDPRRPAEARKYEPPAVDTDAQPQDPMVFFGLIFGMVALIMKMKVAAWLSVFCVAAAFANMRTDTADYKQLLSSLIFALMGVAATYIVPAGTSKRVPK